MSSTRFDPVRTPARRLRPPSDKSISHRAALIAAMAEGETTVEGYLDAADTRSTLEAVKALGAAVAEERRGGGPGCARSLRIARRRAAGPGRRTIDVGNAGTLLRLLPGWLAGQAAGEWTLDGDESIRRRPVDRIAVPLREMGADLRRARIGCRRSRSAARPCTASPTRCRSRAPRSSPACSSPASWPRARRGWSSRAEPRSHGADASRPPAPRSSERRATQSSSSRPSELEPDEHRRPRRHLLGRLLPRRRRFWSRAARSN